MPFEALTIISLQSIIKKLNEANELRRKQEKCHRLLQNGI